MASVVHIEARLPGMIPLGLQQFTSRWLYPSADSPRLKHYLVEGSTRQFVHACGANCFTCTFSGLWVDGYTKLLFRLLIKWRNLVRAFSGLWVDGFTPLLFRIILTTLE